MAAADLDGDGKIEVVVTTTNTSDTGAQVFVFSPNGKLYQPAGTSWQAWPRYNTRAGLGGDTDTNGIGQTGYGCYGLNVGIGNIDVLIVFGIPMKPFIGLGTVWAKVVNIPLVKVSLVVFCANGIREVSIKYACSGFGKTTVLIEIP